MSLPVQIRRCILINQRITLLRNSIFFAYAKDIYVSYILVVSRICFIIPFLDVVVKMWFIRYLNWFVEGISRVLRLLMSVSILACLPNLK